jgi:hypothetical protein
MSSSVNYFTDIHVAALQDATTAIDAEASAIF